jgi:hypothetical protein
MNDRGMVVGPEWLKMRIHLKFESDAAISGARILSSQAKTKKQKIETKRMVDLATTTQNVINLKSPINGIVTMLSANV